MYQNADLKIFPGCQLEYTVLTEKEDTNLKVGVGDVVAADVALSTRMLELSPHQTLQLRHRGVSAEIVVFPAQTILAR